MWGCYLCFTSCNLFESTNSMVSLAPTRRKHQLPEYSSTNWMEAPTSSYTGSNLYNREHLFSLAPPCHPGFSSCNQMEATTSCVQAPTWTSEDNSPPEHLPTSLKYKNNEYTDNFPDKSILTFLSLFCKSDLPQTILQIFYSSVCSAGLLCINSYSHSALLQLVLLFY